MPRVPHDKKPKRFLFSQRISNERYRPEVDGGRERRWNVGETGIVCFANEIERGGDFRSSTIEIEWDYVVERLRLPRISLYDRGQREDRLGAALSFWSSLELLNLDEDIKRSVMNGVKNERWYPRQPSVTNPMIHSRSACRCLGVSFLFAISQLIWSFDNAILRLRGSSVSPLPARFFAFFFIDTEVETA